jgi:myo-inositol-1-phosphate synthase
MPLKPQSVRTGVYLVGARGGLATTAIAGAEMIRRGLAAPTGLVTETPLFRGKGLPALDSLVFGGCDLRATPLFASATEIYRDSGALPYEKLLAIRDALEETDARIGKGTAVNVGAAISRLAKKPQGDARPLAEIVAGFAAEMRAFARAHGAERLVVVNLASTEPPLPRIREHETAAGVARLVAKNRRERVRASTLYALAAARAGAAFINFTPSDAALLPGVRALFVRRGLPFMGDDGKTGETLVKSALAPLFRMRSLRVLSWQGYNILGDRDGLVLAEGENKSSKVGTKDSVLASILGYPLHTHVGIDYVPSLGDRKTAWDFVHFAGFLDYRMAMTFTWHGCDAILAAPLVLDLARLAAVALARGESGAMRHLASYFKRPLDVAEQDLPTQYERLAAYAARLRRGRSAAKEGKAWSERKPRAASSGRRRS